MFNVAVVNIKNLVKYLIILIFTSAFIYLVFSAFASNKNSPSLAFIGTSFADSDIDVQPSETNDLLDSSPRFQEYSLLNNNFFTTLLDQTIPGIREINHKEPTISETSYLESTSPLQFLLSSELPIMTAMIQKSDSNFSTDIDGTVSDITPLEHANTNVTTQVIENNVPNKYTDNYNGVSIKNETNYALTEDILNCDNLDINKKDIMIFHTHTCESYTQTENYQYEESGTFRTIDLNFSVSKVGDSLSDQLVSYGYNVIHDKTYHDYPAYSGSYGRSMATVENLLISHPNTDVILDLHRDAIGDTSYAPSVIIGDEVVSQLMFVIGTDGGGLDHPAWQQNLKFAIAVQQKANELYPGLFRPILLRNSRYNQQLGNAACIIEVGATGNTLEQSMGSMKYLSLVLNEILK